MLPSKSGENLPNVLVESLAMGIPVIATDISGISELVKNDITGLLIEPGDLEALITAIKRYLDDPAYARKLAEQGQKVVREQFDVLESLPKLMQLYTSYGVHDTGANADENPEEGQQCLQQN